MKEILTNNGMVALVDDEDFERLSAYKWRAVKQCRVWYAVATVEIPPYGKSCGMHRLILSPPGRVGVDHRNGNGLDNQKHNLRLANDSQNQANRRNLTLNTSGFRGVCFNKKSNRWQSQIKYLGKNLYLGLFDSIEDAARAYDAKAIELFGEFASPNFPESRAA